jgi:hypothetical protein
VIIPAAVVRPVDRARAIRAILGFMKSDQPAVEHAVREAATDTYPEAVAHLVLALTEAAAFFLSSTPDAEAQLRRVLLHHAQEESGHEKQRTNPLSPGTA